MVALLVISVLCLALSVLLAWFTDRCSLMDTWNKPPILRTAVQNLWFFIVGTVLTAAGVAGMWYTKGTYYGLGALIAKLCIGRALFSYYHRQAYRSYCWEYLGEITASRGEPSDERGAISVRVEAQRLAAERIRKNMNYEL